MLPREPKIKNEPIDLDTLPDSSVGNREGSKFRNAGSTPAGLKRKKKRAKMLEEEIETVERLAPLKQQKRALEEEIEADEDQ